MKYLYYPGCSLEGTAREYDASTRAFMAAAGAELIDLKDWTCCGASAAEATSRLLSLALPAVNLALAEQMDASDQLMVPCSACYLNLRKVTEKTRKDPELLAEINEVLAEKDLRLEGRVQARHLLDVLVNDIGPDLIASKVKTPLSGLSIAPYYGCQCLRPYAVFDDPESPTSMEAVIRAAGASVFPWDMGGKCCGASHMNTKMDVGMELVYHILKAAKGADAVVTVCPMCQMNLEGFQNQVSSKFWDRLDITILYLPQLLGLAMGLSEKELQLDKNLSVTPEFRARLMKKAA